MRVINKVAKWLINAATSLETLEEALFVLSRFTSVETAIRVAHNYLRLEKIKKHEMNQTTFEHALEIIEVTPLKRPKDAINVTTMLEQNLAKIISEDQDYGKMNPVKRVHPRDVENTKSSDAL